MSRLTRMEVFAVALALATAGFALGVALARHHHHGYQVTINPRGEKDSAGGATPNGLPAGMTCGVERAAVKHLTDGFVLPSTPQLMTIDQLVQLAAPAVTPGSSRFTSVPAGSLPETTLVELKNVHVIGVKQEPDSDLHVIVSTAAGADINVELPMAECDKASPYAAVLASARAAADKAMPNVSASGYTPENLTATIVGVLFWDVLHGQRGAPNGVELHPVTFFAVDGSGPPITNPTPTTTVVPPPVTTGPAPTTTAPVPTTTTVPTTSSRDDSADELPGCVKYPGRVYLHHVKQTHCAATFFTTP